MEYEHCIPKFRCSKGAMILSWKSLTPTSTLLCSHEALTQQLEESKKIADSVKSQIREKKVKEPGAKAKGSSKRKTPPAA